MPVISRFYGMVIKMFFIGSEHNPPHIHVIYGDCVGLINIKTLKVIYPTKPLLLSKNGQNTIKMNF